MKKSLAALIAFCVLCLSCQVEEIQQSKKDVWIDYNDTFYAAIDVDSTRTTMDADNNIRWSAEDQLIIFKKTSLGLKYRIQDEYVGETSGYFSKVVSGNTSDDFGAGMSIPHNIAYYPYSENIKFAKSGEDYTLKVNLPSVQPFAHESFGNGTFHMAAVSEDNDLTFKNVMGGIKLLFKGVGEVVSVKVEGNNGERISGLANVTVYAGNEAPQVAMAETATSTIELKCENGVKLNEDAATEFIITVPPTDFENGFTVTVTDPQGNEEIITTTKSNSVSRSALLVMPEKTLTVIEPRDFSTDLSAEGTANSYIVSKAGEYKFKPTKGNSSQSVGTIESAEVLWESFGTDTAPAVGDLIANIKLSGKYIKFTTPETFVEGNAVIAAKDANGTILWSWHIWLTDQPREHVYDNNAGTMMDRNLGATSATSGDVGALGLLYQWGRKDPFLNSSSVTASGSSAASTGTWSLANSYWQTIKIDNAIKNPTMYICGDNGTGWDWLSSGGNKDRWDSKKTIYDPCPAGWRVPDGGDLGNDGFWANAGLGLTNSSDFSNGYIFNTNSSANIWYPAAGYIYGGNNSRSLWSVGEDGYYWSVTSSGYSAYTMSFYATGFSNASEGYRYNAYSVRCFKEGSNIGGAIPSPNPQKGDYIDENGNHGQGVEIDGVVWAPVNVGARSEIKYGNYYTWFEAHNVCPDGWRLPSSSEFKSLKARSQEYVIDGINGVLSTMSNSTDLTNAVFLPYAGDLHGNLGHNYCGYYWTMHDSRRNYAVAMAFSGSGSSGMSSIGKDFQPLPVRCVLIQPSEEADSKRTIDGLTWATRNIGATSHTESGNYYLQSEIDIVCPEGWRIPTHDDIKALMQNYSDLTLEDEVEGRWFSGSNPNANSSTGIFLPIAGYQYLDRDGGTFYNKSVGWYWTKSNIGSDQNLLLCIDNIHAKLDRLGDSETGMPVRCVKGEYTGPVIEPDVEMNSAQVTIDGLTWSSKNVGAENIYDYGDTFTSEEALSACPEGWRLPTKDEMSLPAYNYRWDVIANQYGVVYSDKNRPGIFLPIEEGKIYGNYWTSSRYSSESSSYYALSLNTSTRVAGFNPSNKYAVRCVKGQVDLGLSKTEGASYTLTLKPSTYGWTKSTSEPVPHPFMYDGVYESTNSRTNDSEAIMYIDIVGYETFKLYIRNNGEAGYDYMVVSQLDKAIDRNTSVSDSNLVKASDKSKTPGTAIGNYTEVIYEGIDKGQHRIMVIYKKDSDDWEGTDKGYVLIPVYQ